MELNPQAFFSILWIDSRYKVENPVTVNYTWYGQNDYTFTGEWHDLVYKSYISKERVSITIKTLVVYSTSPENGLDGILGMAMS